MRAGRECQEVGYGLRPEECGGGGNARFEPEGDRVCDPTWRTEKRAVMVASGTMRSPLWLLRVDLS